MRQEGRTELFIECVLLWHVLAGNMLPIMSHAFRRILPIGKVFSKIIVIVWNLVRG